MSVIQFPILFPSSCPASQENLKCIPAITLESAFSLAAWLKLVKLLVLPAGIAVKDVIVNDVLSPNSFANTAAAALPNALCVEG